MNLQNWIRSYVIQIIPIITFFVYVLGFSYYIPYYRTFGINILSHITLSEVLVAAFVPVLICLIVAIVWKSVITAYYNSAYIYFRQAYENLNRMMQFPTNRPQRQAHEIDLKRKLKILTLITIAIIALFIGLINGIDCDSTIKKYILILVAAVVIPYILWMIGRLSEIRSAAIRFKYYTFFGCLIGIGLILILMCLGLSDANAIKHERQSPFEITMTDGRTYNTDSHLYIGESQTSVFLCNKSDKTATILNRQHITSTVTAQ